MTKVKVSVQQTTIPTYKPDAPTGLPMFLNKRVYQGSSGKVYPHTMVEGVSDMKTQQEYTAVYLENEYLLVMILPELGGRIQRIFDKTNNYDAVFYNEVIKPAFTGLTGPRIAGGIEFNWPQHRRPSAFFPFDYTIEEHEDGSVTVWLSEIEQMFHTKGMAGYTLRPGKAYLEIKAQLYNPNDTPQTFLWWANSAVAVNENTQSIFPPDVRAVMDHGNRGVSKFPVATGVYYKNDYSEGVDISWPKNIPVPTSYMAYHSDYDFIGSYDHGKHAGLLHISDHHIAPGKSQRTWGNGDFGSAWNRNLTDENTPYVELMSGAFSNNQPDFAFIAPYEEKSFRQFFVPYKNIGAVKNASLDALLNLEVNDGKARVNVYAPSPLKAAITLTGGTNTIYFRDTAELNPTDSYERSIELEKEDVEDITRLLLCVRDENDKILVQYSPLPEVREKLPKAAKAVKKPKDISSLEELLLAATHLEQQRHAAVSPEPYYLEGLRRDATDIRLNNGYGKLLYNRGEFEKAEKHFRAAIKKSTAYNPNPYDCEPYYNLGIALKRQEKFDEAFDAFYKSIWDSKMQVRGFYQLACICARQERFEEALGFVNQSLTRGSHSLSARNIKTAILRHLERREEAKAFAEETRKLDPLDTGCRYELYRISNDMNSLNELTSLMCANLHNYIELSLVYADAGLYTDAGKVLALISQAERPMLHYYMAYYSNSEVELEIASKCRDIYLPNRLIDIRVLEYAIEHNPSDPLAPYLLACLLYDKGRTDEAITYWEKSLEIAPNEPKTHRNLALAYYNYRRDPETAMQHMERARRFAPDNARIYYEYDRLRKLTNVPPKRRIKDFNANMDLVVKRDDLYIEYVTLLNDLRYYRQALKQISKYTFHPWEGGEGKITAQYRRACIGIAKECLKANDSEGALEILNKALEYPENLGEGKLKDALDCDIYYLLGCACESIDLIEANEHFSHAAMCPDNIGSAKYYNDTPPEMFYYSALALEKLGQRTHVARRFRKLINYFEEHLNDRCEIDYFAVNLPDLHSFDDDLDRNNFVQCCYMGALGYLGLGEKEKADALIEEGLSIDNSHPGLLELRDADEKPVETDEPEIEGGYFKAASW